MRTILVTGANKGIGLAIAAGILTEHEDTVVLMGSRDVARGDAALGKLIAGRPELGERVRVVAIDVARRESVEDAARVVGEQLGPSGRLYGVVNNAGIAAGELGAVLNVNTTGVHHVCEAFLPLLDPDHGRIVNVTSAAGPNFVAECSDAMKRFFLDADTEWADLESLMRECVEMANDAGAFAARGLGSGAAYGLSKAFANTYTLQLARRYPKLAVNACTPGFIETDLTRPWALSSGRTPSDMGMKQPEDGAKSPLFLLFEPLDGNGHYYGSDCKRSPLDRYRAPGAPAYEGD